MKKQVKSTPKKVPDPLFPARKRSFRIGRDIQVTKILMCSGYRRIFPSTFLEMEKLRFMLLAREILFFSVVLFERNRKSMVSNTFCGVLFWV